MTMSESAHNPDRPNLDELGESLRPAVEQVLDEPIPVAARERSLARARRLKCRQPQPWRHRRADLLAVASIAALFLLGLGLVPRPPSEPPVESGVLEMGRLTLPFAPEGILAGDEKTVARNSVEAEKSPTDKLKDSLPAPLANPDANTDGRRHAKVPVDLPPVPRESEGRANPYSRTGNGRSPDPGYLRRYSDSDEEGERRVPSLTDAKKLLKRMEKQLSVAPRSVSMDEYRRVAAIVEASKSPEERLAQARKRLASMTQQLARAPRCVSQDDYLGARAAVAVWGSPSAELALARLRLQSMEKQLARAPRSIAAQDLRTARAFVEKGERQAASNPARLRNLIDTWSRVPLHNTRKVLEDLTRSLPRRERTAILAYYAEARKRGTSGPAPWEKEKGKAKKDKLANKDKKRAKPAPPKKELAVWYQDRSRPSFARVYVGDGNSLDLVSLHVSVTVEGPRARTIVDHVFRNPHNRQLEGTFEYPLPSGASPSYFAMFLGHMRDTIPARFGGPGRNTPLPSEVLARLTPQQLVRQINTAEWGKFQEARVVSQTRALEAYEDVVRSQIDPALLEYAGGNTFRGRVFPIPAKGYNRIILAYEELLPVVRDRLMYRFTLPGRKLHELRFSLQARSAECRAAAFLPTGAKKEEKAGRLTYRHTWKDMAPSGEVRFIAAPTRSSVQATSGQKGGVGPRHLYARLRPELPRVARARPFAKHGVFLLDTSLSEDPDRFGVSMRLLRAILENDTDLKLFNVLTFNAGAAWVEPKGWVPNTPEGRARVFARLDGLLLEGATDLSAALDKVVNPGFKLKQGTPLNCFLLSDGHLTWGETDAPTLVARFEKRCSYPTRFYCYRTGLGQENAELYAALARRGGGVFQCYGASEVRAASQAHRRQCLQVQRVRFVGGPQASDVLVAGRQAAVYPGGELVVAARFRGTGRTRVVLEGTFQGEKVTRAFPLVVQDGGELAARGWGEVAVAGLLALHDPRLDGLVTAYCQEFSIASRAASFLVLENDEDYKRLNLEAERGKTLKGDLAAYIEQAWGLRGKDSSGKAAFTRLLELIDARTHILSGANGPHVRKLLGLLREADFELRPAAVAGALLKIKKADKAYLEGRRKDRRDVHAYLNEAERRARAGDRDGAVRVLSSIIEEHAGRGEALRLVGYRLLALKQPGQAAQLFARVQRQRPFEPHSYRDLARSLDATGKYGLAAVQYEAVLAGTWHNRFGAAIKEVVLEEYARMMQAAIRSRRLGKKLADHFGERLEKMRRPQPKSDLRVTISWNTDATDIDLWVIEPDGTKVFYGGRSKTGGVLSADMTQGYGPERYYVPRASRGEYTIIVHYFRANPNLLGGETHVDVTVTRHAGSPEEKVQRRTVILRRQGEQVQVCKVKF
jgi:hypothetical protein